MICFCHSTRLSMWWGNTFIFGVLSNLKHNDIYLTLWSKRFALGNVDAFYQHSILPFLLFVFLLPLCECFHSSGTFYNYILYSVVLYHMGVAVRECEDCLCFYRITISEFDFLTTIVWFVSGVNFTFILFLSHLWTMKR